MSNYRFPSTEQLQNMSEDSSLLFFFKSGFQSWVMFAQKYVIVDFLLPGPSSGRRPGSQTVITSSPGEHGCAFPATGQVRALCQQPWMGAAAAEKKHSLRVPNNVCFSSPLDKQILTGFFLTNSRLPFPYIWGTHSVYMSLCDFDVPAPSSSPSFPYGEGFFHPSDVTSSGKPSLLTHLPAPEDESVHTDTEFSVTQLESSARALGYIPIT